MKIIPSKVLSVIGITMLAGLLASCGSSSTGSTSTSSGGSSTGSTSGGSSTSSSTSSSSSNSSSSSSGVIVHPSGPPVSTPGPNATGSKAQTRAFEEQTRAPEVSSSQGINQEVITSNVKNPWGIAFMPDGRMLVTERNAGSLRIVTQDGQVSSAVSGIPNVAQGSFGNQGGLLDVSVSPKFAQDRMVYFSYSDPRGNETGTNVARGRLSDDDKSLENVEVIFEQNPGWNSTLHYGSRIVWNSDDTFYLTLGERSDVASRNIAQRLNNHLGKVLYLKSDGSAAGTGFDGSLPEIWSYGHRNVQGADIHPTTGLLWTMEHGPRGGDELNRPQKGKNYGWPDITYGIDYSGASIGQGITNKSGMEQPIYYFDPVIAPAALTFYDGGMFTEWYGDVLLASLTPGGIVRLELDGEMVIGEQRYLTGKRARDIEIGPDGAIWLAVEDSGGQLIKLTVK